MATGVLTTLILAVFCWYGLYRLVLAITAEEEAKHHAGELAWQEWESR